MDDTLGLVEIYMNISVNGKEIFAPRGLRPWHGGYCDYTETRETLRFFQSIEMYARQREDPGKCFAVGMNDYLSKPILIPELLAMVNKWLAIEHTVVSCASVCGC